MPATPGFSGSADGFAARTFHHRDFPREELLGWKEMRKWRLGLAIPTLNEAATIASIVASARQALVVDCPLLDEILVIDSGSTDGTREVAAAAGAAVHLATDILPDVPSQRGKGENLWKAGFVSSADVLCFVDGDISDFSPYFVSGLLGPLLRDDRILFAKAFYERPLAPGGAAPDPGGGRVTEILIRPVFSLLFPDLCGIIQPLGGEYAMRRSLLETLSFPSGYGVEAAHLIDIFRAHGLEAMAQVDLEHRAHRVRTTAELGRMAYRILLALWPRLPDGAGACLATLPVPPYQSILWNENGCSRTLESLIETTLPPLLSLDAYRARHPAR